MGQPELTWKVVVSRRAAKYIERLPPTSDSGLWPNWNTSDAGSDSGGWMWLAYEGKRGRGGSASELGGLLFGWICPRGRSSRRWYGLKGCVQALIGRLRVDVCGPFVWALAALANRPSPCFACRAEN